MPSYHDSEKQNNTMRLRELLKELPHFAGEFFRGIAPTTTSKTRIAYAYDLKVFFQYLLLYNDNFIGKNIKDVSITDLTIITPDDLELFMDFLTDYTKENNEKKEVSHYQNDEKAKARKLASIRSMYSYFYKKRKIPANPAMLVSIPKIHEKSIVRLELNEVERLINEIESGEHLSARQKIYHAYTKRRDAAMISLLLGTGMRVSECVGIDINDLDFNVNGVKITRKGGNEVVLYFGDEVREALLIYMDERKKKTPRSRHENAVFLSMQDSRITVRAVQNLVKKYCSIVTRVKNISPHKLRSTYGTNLYRATGDIYLVADVLGHKDVNTTRKHYAQIDDERRRSAAQYIRLRAAKKNTAERNNKEL